MAAKIVIICSLAVLAQSALLPVTQRNQRQLSLSDASNRDLRRTDEVSQRQRQQRQRPLHAIAADELDTEPNYAFAYSVLDDITGDIKSQQESRRGDRVRGQYRMMEADGTERIVDYTADDHHGFHAIVRHQPVGTVLRHSVPVRVPVSIGVPIPYATSNSQIIQRHHNSPMSVGDDRLLRN